MEFKVKINNALINQMEEIIKNNIITEIIIDNIIIQDNKIEEEVNIIKIVTIKGSKTKVNNKTKINKVNNNNLQPMRNKRKLKIQMFNILIILVMDTILDINILFPIILTLTLCK